MKYRLVDNTLEITETEDFSPERSCFCGQAFRWEKAGDRYRCVIGDELVYIEKTGDRLIVSPCTEDKVDFYLDYFDFHTNYTEIENAMGKDEILSVCIPYAKGIRVFNQAPFETLISFLISQNNNIKRITGIIDRLCRACGEKRLSQDGEEYYTFPTPEALCRLSKEQLHEMGMGYRDEYIYRCARAVRDGFSLSELKTMSYIDAKKELLTLHGVGPKVADCILLFSLGHSEAFPMDVWMKRAVCTMFFDGRVPSAKELSAVLDGLGKNAGKIQQYIFHYARMTM